MECVIVNINELQDDYVYLRKVKDNLLQYHTLLQIEIRLTIPKPIIIIPES